MRYDSDYYKWSNMAFAMNNNCNKMNYELDRMLLAMMNDTTAKPIESEYVELKRGT